MEQKTNKKKQTVNWELIGELLHGYRRHIAIGALSVLIDI